MRHRTLPLETDRKVDAALQAHDVIDDLLSMVQKQIEAAQRAVRREGTRR